MLVTFLGHAGLLIETQRARLLVDPWLSHEGAYQAAWFQYPSNSHIQIGGLNHISAVIITHEHEDHFDREFLSRLPSHVPVFMPNYPSRYLKEQVRELGFSAARNLPQWRAMRIGDVSFFFVSELSPMNHDSALVIEHSGRTLLNLNDARLSSAQLDAIRHRSGKVAALLFQSTGASWHPMCYTYEEEHKRHISIQKAEAKLRSSLKTIKLLSPDIAVPFAGPPCFLDPELIEYNHDSYFMDQWSVCSWLQEHGVQGCSIFLPGDMYDLGSASKIPDRQWQGFDPMERFAHIEQMAPEKAPTIALVKSRFGEPARPVFPVFDRYFHSLLGMSPYFNRNIDMRVGFDVFGTHGGEWTVDFRAGHEGVYDQLDECNYVYRLESRWLYALLNGRLRWENFFLSLRFTASRNPDLYCDYLLGLLKFAEVTPLRSVEHHEMRLRDTDTFVIEAEGQRYRIARTCPHAGANLDEYAEVLPGRVLRCLAHYHEFSLDSGRCLNANGPPLSVKRL
ncbi:MAG: MBL fold metallo-hydrolase [Dehalococcoidia bacterium]